LAYETGFKKRTSKLSPKKFIDILLYGSNSEKKSLNQCAVEAKNSHKISISKQGIDNRFNDCSVSFIKAMLEDQIRSQITSEISSELLNKFNCIKIKDSTSYDISSEHMEKYPGSGGSASKAGMKIQFEFDLKSGSVLDLNLTSAIRQDTTDATQTLDGIVKDDLIIRDMGYSVLDVFEQIKKKEAFFISRLEPKVLI
jgi:hypothetical protein